MPIDAVLLMSVGELSARKNHKVVIRALARLDRQDIHYVIVGIGPLDRQLKSLAQSLGVGNRVHFLGYRRDIPELYKAADICVFPSLQEGLPVAVMEAMACGLPIVASRIRGTEDLLVDGSNILIDRCDDVDAFADAIIRLSEDATLRGRIAADNQEKSKRFDLAIIDEKMKEIYGFGKS